MKRKKERRKEGRREKNVSEGNKIRNARHTKVVYEGEGWTGRRSRL